LKHSKNKNIATIISITFLIIAMLEGLPYGFFQLLRLILFGSSAYLGWLSYVSKKFFWTWSFVIIGVVFNPILPLYLDRNLWRIIDLFVATFLIVSIFAFKLSIDSNKINDGKYS
jgi:hypothetical protein